METIKQTSKEYFKTLSIIHAALTIGPVVFGLIIFLVVSLSHTNALNELTKIFYYVVPIITVIALLSANIFYKSKLKTFKDSDSLQNKLTTYRGLLIMRYASAEGASFFAVVAAFITETPFFLIFVGLLLLLMIYWRPTRESLKADLQLSVQEVSAIDDPDAVVIETAVDR